TTPYGTIRSPSATLALASKNPAAMPVIRTAQGLSFVIASWVTGPAWWAPMPSCRFTIATVYSPRPFHRGILPTMYSPSGSGAVRSLAISAASSLRAATIRKSNSIGCLRCPAFSDDERLQFREVLDGVGHDLAQARVGAIAD